mmetsp:Transcript_2313/g.3244  ORF Transcript_2313/g.3244 Transcript_2313/m.3244 type:complete len:97 (-) Transcript_2313:628-918(-)|eukprot:CAMPEP_0185741088 /NCGR_PEP_ID=MMETSP1171-20130828/38769_1 /TAXON_ID=374046 /ORGANISM="Helicotheca tamensis, Strain CCMP826" /LENGTH=96 /DNA_ID=CAMNT_0028413031 /DNA_START=776 /DNA_END=1066 /DNA_ORIENTATION=+
MVYIGADGNLQERRSPWRFSIITDALKGIWGLITLFFGTVSGPPNRIEENRSRTTYAERQGIRRVNPSSRGGGGGTTGGNVRGVRNLGEACAPAGG